MLALAACTGTSEQTLHTFTVKVNLSSQLRSDSAWLVVEDVDYGLLRQVGAEMCQNGRFVFRGQTDRATLAFLRLGTDSTRVEIPFALSATDITIDLNTYSWLITGGCENVSYQRFLNSYRSMSLRRDSLRGEYERFASDSSLTAAIERRILEHDSLLSDSMQRYLRWRVRGNDVVSKLVKLRLGHQLDSLHRN